MSFVSVKITQKQLFLGWSMGAYYRLLTILLLEGDSSIPLNIGMTCQHVPDVIRSTLRSWHLGLLVDSVCCRAAPRLFVEQWVQGRTCCATWGGRDSSGTLAGNLTGTDLALLL